MSLESKKISELTEEQRKASLTALRGYRCYIAKLIQVGENAPSAIVLENDIGEVTFSYIYPGTYRYQISETPSIDKCMSIISVQFPGEGSYASSSYDGSGTGSIITAYQDGTQGNDILNGANIFEFRIYN